MAFKYASVVPWGRNFDEYCRMFALGKKDRSARILGCGDGPASFNSESARQGMAVVSIDPLYHMTVEQIRQAIAATYDDVIRQTEQNREKFIWDAIGSVAELGQIRMAAMQEFLADFEQGKHESRYLAQSLPHLSFAEQSFDLALCSHFLFLHDEHLDLDFHLAAIEEMLRVAREVRIFPLLDVNGVRSAYVASVMKAFAGYQPEIRQVDYEFQRGGDRMLLLQRAP